MPGRGSDSRLRWVGNTTNSDLPYLMGSTGSLLGLPTGHSAKDSPTHWALGPLCFSCLSKVCCGLMLGPFLGLLTQGTQLKALGQWKPNAGPVLMCQRIDGAVCLQGLLLDNILLAFRLPCYLPANIST